MTNPTASLDNMTGDVQCKICEQCSYICEYCSKPCCTPCSEYDPGCQEYTDFPKGRNGGIRNHPECIANAKKPNQFGKKRHSKGKGNKGIPDELNAQLERLNNLQNSVYQLVERAKGIA